MHTHRRTHLNTEEEMVHLQRRRRKRPTVTSSKTTTAATSSKAKAHKTGRGSDTTSSSTGGAGSTRSDTRRRTRKQRPAQTFAKASTEDARVRTDGCERIIWAMAVFKVGQCTQLIDITGGCAGISTTAFKLQGMARHQHCNMSTHTHTHTHMQPVIKASTSQHMNTGVGFTRKQSSSIVHPAAGGTPQRTSSCTQPCTSAVV